MIRSIEKLKVRIDQNLNRAEKSEALSEDVVKVENKVTSLKQVCQSVTKKLAEGTSTNKGNDGAAVEKRIRKTAEFALGQTFQENGRSYLKHEHNAKDEQSGGPLSQFLFQGASLLNDLATSHVTYEIGVEKLVLHTLTSIVDDHIPQLTKEKKTLNSLLLDFDAAKSRLVSHRAKESQASANNGGGSTYSVANSDSTGDVREERLQTELSDIENKVNAARDNVELQMHTFLARESEIGGLLLKYFELKKEYHRQAADRIANEEAKFRQLIEQAIAPVFASDLQVHLQRTNTQIALPIRICVCRLLQLDVCEEGIFRVAAPTLKIRRLASLIDTGDCSDDQLLDINDPHIFAGTLKLYLRELPTPLLTPYSRWINQCSMAPSIERRREVIHSLLHNLPQPHRFNLHYLLSFLNLVASNSDANRMTASNLSIVLAPNLLWNSEAQTNGSADTSSLSHTNVINDIVESLISDVHWYFQGKVTDYKDIEDFFRETTLEPPKQIGVKVRRSGSAASKGSPSSPAVVRVTPVPKPRQSRPKGAPPPPAPKPMERHSMQPTQLADSTNL